MSLRSAAREFEQRSGFHVHVVFTTELPALSPASGESLACAVREALLNIEKHARARSAVITAFTTEDAVVVVVADDGMGIGHARNPGRSNGIGLDITRDRLARVGGSLSVTDNPDGGTVVRGAGSPMRKTRLLVVDDHPDLHEGVRLLVLHADNIELIGEAVSGKEAIEVITRTSPDVILLDVRLPDMLADETVRRIRVVSPSSKIVLFTAHLSPSVADQATRLGVNGLLGKDASPKHFLDVITRVARGEILTTTVTAQALRRAAEKLHTAPLTPREHEILRRAAMGESNAKIAQATFLSPTTVKSYLQTAFQKLDAHNRVEAVAKLAELELL